jgi:hypothetical protein
VRKHFWALHLVGKSCGEVRIQPLKDIGCTAVLAAIFRTQAVVALEGLRHDPLGAVGALLLELSGLSNQSCPRRSNVFRPAYRHRMAEDAREQVAERRGHVAHELCQEVLVSEDDSRGLASHRQPGAAAPWIAELLTTLHAQLMKRWRHRTRKPPTPVRPNRCGRLRNCDRPRHPPALGNAGQRVIHKSGAFRIDPA